MHTHNWPFHYVNRLALQPKLDAVFGQANHLTDIFARELAAAAGTTNTLRVLSVGSGDCSLEMLLSEVIWRDFNVTCVFTCFDPSDEGFLGATRLIEAKKSAFRVIQQLPAEGSFDAAFAHHSLHHVSDLEELFTFVRRAIGLDGVFVISDMIGRNGHQRWPEAKRLAERLFSKLPSVLGAAPRDFIMRSDPPPPPTRTPLTRSHVDLRRRRCDLAEYPDFDYSKCDGKASPDFEGVRSQDILPLLRTHFVFEKLVAFGGIAFEFVNHRLARNFDRDKPGHKEFLVSRAGCARKGGGEMERRLAK